MSVNRRDGNLVSFLLASIRFRCELDDGMKGYLNVRQVFLRQVVKVGVAVRVRNEGQSAVLRYSYE